MWGSRGSRAQSIGNARGLAIHAKTVNHLMERQRQHALGVEERAATADGAERERKYAEPCGDVVAAHQQEQDCRAGEHRHLDDHPEVTSRPPVGVRTKGRRPVEQEPASRTVLRFDFPVDSSAHAHAVKLTPHLDTSGVGREPFVKGHALGTRQPDARHAAGDPATIPAASAGLPGATRVISGAEIKSLTTLGGRALSGR